MNIIIDIALKFFTLAYNKMKWVGIVFFLLMIINSCDTTSSVKPSQDQTFIKLYGGNGSEEGKDIALLPDESGYILVGSSTSGTLQSKDVYVVRVNNIGDKVWESRFGGEGDDVGNSVIIANESIYVCGEKTQDSLGIPGFRDVYVLNLNLNDGSLIGQPKIYGNKLRDEYGTDIIKLQNGGFFISSTMNHPDTSKYFLIETDINLDTIPTRSRYIGTKGVHNYSQKSFESDDSFNPFVCFGTSERIDESSNNRISNYFHSFVYRSNSEGPIFPTFYGEEIDNQFCFDVDQTDDGGFILAGLTSNGILSREIVIKLDRDRIEQNRFYSSGEFDRNDEGVRIFQTRDRGYIISSTIEFDDPINDEISLLKLNESLEEEWRKTFGSNVNDKGAKVVELTDGSFLVIGTIGFEINPDSRSKMCLMKVNSGGELIPLK